MRVRGKALSGPSGCSIRRSRGQHLCTKYQSGRLEGTSACGAALENKEGLVSPEHVQSELLQLSERKGVVLAPRPDAELHAEALTAAYHVLRPRGEFPKHRREGGAGVLQARAPRHEEPVLLSRVAQDLVHDLRPAGVRGVGQEEGEARPLYVNLDDREVPQDGHQGTGGVEVLTHLVQSRASELPYGIVVGEAEAERVPGLEG
mmetsp:Transcript_80457/g.181555  ORF Transcript_80457/g.181555 Transcript_80457/m.181555 type:complete len:204 (-) Transcript_80457:34-645(-)